jgi:hypothetical protein
MDGVPVFMCDECGGISMPTAGDCTYCGGTWRNITKVPCRVCGETYQTDDDRHDDTNVEGHPFEAWEEREAMTKPRVVGRQFHRQDYELVASIIRETLGEIRGMDKPPSALSTVAIVAGKFRDTFERDSDATKFWKEATSDYEDISPSLR